MQPKRLLFIIRSYPPDHVGGAARSTQVLAEGMAARGHDVHVLRLCPRGEEADYIARAKEKNAQGPGTPKFHVMGIRNIYWAHGGEKRGKLQKALWHLIDLHNPLAARDVRRFLKKLRPDVVNTSVIDGFSPSILREVKRAGAKLIHTMRDYYLICSRSGLFKDGHNCEQLCTSCKVVRNINRHNTPHVDLFLSNSAFVADQHRCHGVFGPEKPCAVQWNMNDMPMAPGPHSRAPDHINFGFIGRIAPTKGVEKLLEAARLMAQSGRSWSLVIAGGGDASYVEKLKAAAADLPQVKFLGWSDAASFYSAVDVVICPSVYNEPLPRVIYEAYGFARPVVASRVGGNPEVVEEGQTGLIYAGEDAKGLAAHMEQFRAMSDGDFTRFSENALRLGYDFTPDAVLDRMEGHFASVLGEKAEA